MKEKGRPVLVDIDVSIRMPGDLAERLNDLAKVTGRSRSDLATMAIEEFVSTEERRVRAVREGMEDAEAGRVVDHSEALRELIAPGVCRR